MIINGISPIQKNKECDHPTEKQKIYMFFVNEIGTEENPKFGVECILECKCEFRHKLQTDVGDFKHIDN